jgi:hypothetical protein
MRNLIVIVTACAVGVGLSLGFAGRGHTQGAPNADCATLSIPVNSDHVLAYDPQTGHLDVDYYGPSGHLEHATVDANDPVCRSKAGVGRAIAHALAAARDLHAGDCAHFKAVLNGAPVVAKGGLMPNVAAAKKFVDQEC